MLFILFVFIYWCPTRFFYQITCVSFNSNTTGVLFLLSMVLLVLLVFTASNYPLCIFKLLTPPLLQGTDSYVTPLPITCLHYYVLMYYFQKEQISILNYLVFKPFDFECT